MAHPFWPHQKGGGVSSEARPLSSEAATSTAHIVVRASNTTEELVTAAHWLRHFIETSTQPTRIALIVPNLGEERPTLEATLRNILTPELQSIDADLSSTPYSFSTGAPLAETPMVATALDVIRWLTGPLPLDRVTTLLLSPYIGTFDDLEARAAFDAFTFRRTPLLRPEIGVARIHRLASASPPVAKLLAPLAARRPGDTLRSHADWMEFVRDTLRDANFPGDRPLTAQEFRDARTWDHVLDAVATLDFTGARVDFRTALEALGRQARATVFVAGLQRRLCPDHDSHGGRRLQLRRSRFSARNGCELACSRARQPTARLASPARPPDARHQPRRHYRPRRISYRPSPRRHPQCPLLLRRRRRVRFPAALTNHC